MSIDKQIRDSMTELELQTAKSLMAIQPTLESVKEELVAAIGYWPAMNSAHEGYGVLLEEIDELWAHVKMKQKNRNLDAMKKEALQVAAMAVRFAIEVCGEERGRK